MPLYKSMVCPRLEYITQFFIPSPPLISVVDKFMKCEEWQYEMISRNMISRGYRMKLVQGEYFFK